MSFVFSDLTLLWTALFLFFIAIEAINPTISYMLACTCGAGCAGICSFIGAHWSLQLLVFISISAVSLAFFKKWSHKKSHYHDHKTNSDALIGKTGTVSHAIEPHKKGLVYVANELWSARSTQEETLKVGTLVEVISLRGSHIIVQSLNK